ncbi:MAG: hypothetical protein FWD66_10940 [Paludibacter sp.]|nr:hypothetical protein [Paludibacter sp.]
MNKFIEVSVFVNKSRTVTQKELININHIFRVYPDEQGSIICLNSPIANIIHVEHAYEDMINLIQDKC